MSTINGSSRRGFGAAVSKQIFNKKSSTSIQALNEHGAGKVLDPTRLGQLSIRSKTDNNDVIYAAPSNLMYGHSSMERLLASDTALGANEGVNGVSFLPKIIQLEKINSFFGGWQF